MTSAAPKATSLVGRDVERELIADAIARVASGYGGSLLIEGVPGIGKTRLLNDARNAASLAGVGFVGGAGDEMDPDRPFGPFIDALQISAKSEDPLNARIADLLAAPGDPSEARYLIVEGIIELLDAVAARGSVVLTIDDLHWADRSTLLTLHHLVRALPELSPVLVVATFRPFAASSDSGRIVAGVAQNELHVKLDPLSAEDQFRLVQAVMGAQPGPQLAERLAETGGNPLYLTELLRALEDDDAIRIGGGVAELIKPVLPPSLRLTILRRLAFMSQEALVLLRWAAVLGTEFELDDLAAVAGERIDDLSSWLAEPRRMGVIVDSGHGVAFGHALVRDAVYQEIPASERVIMHRHTAHVLAAAGVPASRVAHHYDLLATQGDGEAVDWMRRAAHEVSRTTPEAAVGLLERARALVDAADPRANELEAEMLRPLNESGRVQEAERRATELLLRQPSAEVARVARRGLITARVMQNKYAEALELVTREIAETDEDDLELPQLLGAGALCRLVALDADGAMAWSRDAAEIARRHGDYGRVGLALNNVAANHWVRGRLGEALEVSADAVSAARTSGRPGPLMNVLCGRSRFLTSSDRFEEARLFVDEAGRIVRESGLVTLTDLLHRHSAILAFAQGRWDAALADAEAALTVLDVYPTPSGGPGLSDPFVQILFQSGRIEEAETAQGRIDAAYGPLFAHWPTRALLAAAAGRPADGIRTVEQMLEVHRTVGSAPDLRPAGQELLQFVAGERRADLETALLEAANEAAARAPEVATLVGLAQSMMSLHSDDPDLGLQAVATMRTGPRPFELAAACETAGGVVVRHGRRDEGIALLVEAADGYEAVGAERARGRASQRLRKLGVRHRPARAKRRPVTGWESLTETESRVSVLVSQGLSNRDIGERMFISHRTVATHLQHIFQKVGVASRTELAAAASRRATS